MLKSITDKSKGIGGGFGILAARHQGNEKSFYVWSNSTQFTAGGICSQTTFPVNDVAVIASPLFFYSSPKFCDKC